MTRETLRRRLAKALLGFGIRIAPRHATQWGQAMLGELREVKGDWAALAWAAGGTSVLAKHALVALAYPGRNAPALMPGGGFFEKEGSMRKASLITIATCTALALSFLLAPAFRQGLGVSMEQWRTMSEVEGWRGWPPQNDRALRMMQRHAENNHDAEAMAYVAVHTPDARESTRLADEAVELDPRLTWIYNMASPTPEGSERWIQKLKQWDPQNALPYFMEAEKIDNAQVLSGKFRHNVDDEPLAWKNALASAFASSKLDAYSGRLTELDRKIALRFDIQDPYQLISQGCYPCLPGYTYQDSRRYVKWQLNSAEKLEARGDQKEALEKYLTVIRFAEMTNSVRMPFMYNVLKDGYEHVAAIAQKRGDRGQAALYSLLAGDALRARDSMIAEWGQRMSGNPAMDWNVDVLRVAGLLLPIFACLLLICALTIVVKNRPLRLDSLHAGRGTIALGAISAVGMLLACALLYVSYWPYAEMFREFLQTGKTERLDVLMAFLGFAQLPLGGTRYLNMNVGVYQFYFWLTVIVLCVIALTVIAARHIHWRSKARATT